jgi:beta-galactosidase
MRGRGRIFCVPWAGLLLICSAVFAPMARGAFPVSAFPATNQTLGRSSGGRADPPSVSSAQSASASVASVPAFDTILYGASYYLEYMPYDRLEEDVRLMEKAGINLVRLGESTWGMMEPRDGEFDFDWLKRVLDRLHKSGIRVILGTPTYSIPAWLFKKHPEIQVKQINSPRYTYGLRQMTDLTHPTYRFYAERIIRELVSRFRDHPAIIGYQLDNETHSSGTADTHVQAMFRDRVKKIFGSPAALNKAWGLNYWGQNIADFDELPPRDGILNPGYKLEWERFEQQIITDFLAWQAGIVRELKRPDQFITTDFAGFPEDANIYDIAKSLDIPAVNIYAAFQDAMDGRFFAFCGDVNRSLKGGNYLVTETTAQTTGWDSKGQFPPYPGQLRLAAYANIASGANLVAYWHWHSLHYGQETYWKGVLAHDLEPGRVYEEASRVAHELRRVGPELAGLKKRNDVAILFSLDSLHALNFMPFDDSVGYMTALGRLYEALYKLRVETDFVFPSSQNLAGYRLIIVPALYIADDALLGRLADYVKSGGHLLVTFKSGFCNENSTVRWVRAPGPLRQAAGFSYQEFTNLKAPLRLKGDPFGAGEENTVSVWAEYILPEGAKALAFYDHPVFGRYPAITRNSYGSGTLTYEGTLPSEALQEKILEDTLGDAGVTIPDKGLPTAVKVRHAVLRNGKTARFYFNFSEETREFIYEHGDGIEVLSGKPVTHAEKITLPAWDLAIIEER